MGYSGPNLGPGCLMSERFHDDDIEFDFFEDVDTSEQSPPDWLHEEQERRRSNHGLPDVRRAATAAPGSVLAAG